uniref:Groucho/TLE N-terminal Q-rich domain-containing protein n=1 Tax=Malurus cyaneus samueli TaxID=2593467 RepID=A0A8C5UBX6_9PASS
MQKLEVPYYEMSYGLNIEMHKQAEIVKRLSAICAQMIPFLTQEHQQQVLQAVERAKQVTMGELNSIVGQQLQQLSQHASPLPLAPHPSSLSGASGAAGLLALSGALMAQLATREDRVAQDGDNRGKGWVNPLKRVRGCCCLLRLSAASPGMANPAHGMPAAPGGCLHF